MEVFSINVNGLNVETITEVGIFLEERRPSIVFMQETKRRADQLADRLCFPSYRVSTLEREGEDKRGGGLCALWREDIELTPYELDVAPGKEWIRRERQWFLFHTKTMSIALANIYMACTRTDSDSFKQWNQDLCDVLIHEVILLRQEGFSIVMMGDYNAWLGDSRGGCFAKNHSEINFNGEVIGGMIDVLGLCIANVNEKHGEIFTRVQYDHSGIVVSQSCLDLCLHDPKVPLAEFEIVKSEYGSISSDHFMLRVVLDLTDKKPARVFRSSLGYSTRAITVAQKKSFARISTLRLRSVPLPDFVDFDQHSQIIHIEQSLLSTARQVLSVRRRRVPRMRVPSACVTLIRERRELLKDIKNGTSNRVAEYYLLDKKIKKMIRVFRHQQVRRLKISLAQKDPTRERFWAIFRQLKSRSSRIPALRDSQVCLQIEDYLLLQYFLFALFLCFECYVRKYIF